MTQVVDVAAVGQAAAVEVATRALREHGLVVAPTDTIYGVVADAFDLDATAALFRARGQDRGAPLTVLLRSPKQLIGLTPQVPEAADRLIAAFWPGPLTLVLPAAAGMRWDIGRGAGTVAVRMPLDELVLELVREVGPLAASAASVVGGAAPTTAAEARAQLADAVACYLDDGPRAQLAPSTIVDLTGSDPQVLREGALSAALVLEVATGALDPFVAATRAADELEHGPGGADPGRDVAGGDR